LRNNAAKAAFIRVFIISWLKPCLPDRQATAMERENWALKSAYIEPLKMS
jgi:hypothetical protein